MATHAPKADIRSDWIESRHRVDTCPSPERVPAARGAPKAEHRRGVGTIRPALHISRTAIVGSGQPHPIDIKLGLTRKIVILCGKPQAAGKRGRASKVVPRASDDRLFACSADWTER
jgi:hypothetical protein